MRTFKNIQDDVYNQLKESATDPNFWSLQEVKDAINDTYIFIADETFCFKLDAIIVVKAGIPVYKLPENFIMGSLTRVEFNSKKIVPITSEELDAQSSTWRTQTANEPWHFIPPGDLCNSDELILFPKPDTDGSVYNSAGAARDSGIITTIGDDSYEQFEGNDGVIVTASGDVKFSDDNGAVQQILTPDGNLHVFGARYPKRLYNDNDVFLHPVSYNPRKIITLGSLAILFAKEGEGKDIAKASYFNKRFTETLPMFQRKSVKKMHRMRSISESSLNGYGATRGLNLGEHYPTYIR